ncbi:MAG: fibronectin type III domain-containing protein, partial [Bacteroidales bacterium]|nr:fibronectin type III domain-containing protein [Bacteroidales bacterium]
IHNFDTVFTWDGHSNILLSVKRDNGSYSGSQTFVAYAASAIKSRYIYQDSGPYDINTVNGGSTTTTVGNVRLISCGAGCAAPSAMTTTGVTYNAATVTWSGSDSTEIGIHQGLWDETGVNFVTVTNHTYTFTGLTPNTQYTVAARNLCEDNMTSGWNYVTFTTEDLPCFAPTNIQVSNETPNGGKITWTPGGNETEWLVNVFRTGIIDTNYTVINTPMCNVSGLYADMTYTVRVASVCGGIETVWCDSTATLTTTACLPPTNVEAVANGHNAMVTWTSSGANEYHVLWYLEGFTTGADSVVVTNGTTNATITGLEQGETYDIYVYAYCDGQRSAQAGQTQVTITGIDDVNSSLINLYPNPANTTVTVDGIQGEALVTIVDMNGRTVFSEKAVGKLTIDLNGMAQGAYFVRITGENTTAIRKLIVK